MTRSVVRSMKNRSWEITIIDPGQLSRRSSSWVRVSMSRSLVGSSRKRTFGSSISSRRIWVEAALTAGEVADGRPLLLLGEAELLAELTGGHLAALAEVDAVAHLLNGLQDPEVRVELGDLLGEVGELDGLADDDLPGGGLLVALGAGGLGERAQQRGLARAVDADQADAVAGAELPGEVGEEGLGPGLDGHVLQVEHGLAEAGVGELHQLAGVARRRHVGDELVGGLDAVARLGGTGGGASAQPGQLLAHEVLPLGLLGGGDPLPLGAGEDVVAVAALVLVDGAALDVPHAGADLVEEPPVVGDADEGGAPGAQVAYQPGDALDVEVVGGLVEDDQVLLVDEELGQRDTAALATGERGDDGVEPVLEAGEGQAAEEPGEHVADLGAARPLVVGEIADDLLADGLLRVQGVVLGEDAETQPAVVGDAAGVRVLQLGEHPDEGGLAVAVAAHDTDPVALGHPEGYAVEQGTGAVHLADLLDIDQIDGHFTPA